MISPVSASPLRLFFVLTLFSVITNLIIQPSAIAEGWDQRVHTGTLDNGLSYYLYDSENPKDPFNVRLIVNAGSVDEEKPSGVAHIVEHMVFQSTRSHPETIHHYIQQLGWRTGVQINAMTRETETQFMIRTRPQDALDIKGTLALAADMVFGAQLIEEQWLSERSVILEELRNGDHVAGRINRQKKDLLRSGSQYVGRSTIGTEPTINAVTIDEIKDFYNRYYVASNMTLVISGRIDVEQTKQSIEQYFGNAPLKAAPDRSYVELPIDDQLKIGLVQDEEGTTSQVTLALRTEMPDRKSDQGKRAYLKKYILNKLIRDQLRILAQNHDLGVENLSFVTQEPTNKRVTWAFNVRTKEHKHGLNMLLQVVERLNRDGISQTAFDKAVKNALQVNQNNVNYSKLRTYADWEDKITSSVMIGSILQDPALQSEGNAQTLQSLTLSEINDTLKQVLVSKDIVILFQAPGKDKVVLTDKKQIQSAMHALRSALLRPEWPKKEVVRELPATDLPILPQHSLIKKPGTLISETIDEKRNITEWNLSNGDKVIWLKHETEDERLYISAQSNPGFNNDKFNSDLSQVAIQLWDQSGYKFWSQSEYDRWFNAQTLKWNFVLNSGTLNAGIVSKQSDIALALEHYALMLSYNKIRPEAFAQFQEQFDKQFNPKNDEYAIFLYGESLSSQPTGLTREKLEDAAISLSRQPVTWYIVGPQPSSSSKEAFTKIAGSVPRENKLKSSPPLQLPGFREAITLTNSDQNRAEVKISLFVDQDWQPETAFILSSITPVLQQAIKNELRLKLGGIYTSKLEVNLDPDTNRTTVSISFMCAPERAHELKTAALSVIKNAPDHLKTTNIIRLQQDIIFAEESRLTDPSTLLRRLSLSYRRYGDSRYLETMGGLASQVTNERLIEDSRKISLSGNIAAYIKIPKDAL
ncbi:M16 family metallopeptidase [Brucellaceae bacterium C25G]